MELDESKDGERRGLGFVSEVILQGWLFDLKEEVSTEEKIDDHF